ncbi:malonate decarboxylase holo-ACP synthase [Acinetobacter sp. S54]|nr:MULTISPECIES: malonate decarboxylase holo-ACP synthase [unclassified Acinetobacter]MBK0062535.1 malonate decarboxylase holo-ACP synthase [Acinetobacter sp. S55]MBK0066339.1 malonate decarboxylase holo-ACP synthase [Acinetobacter sp. S54]
MAMISLQPHDLLWGMTSEILSDDAPQWVIDTVNDYSPVVVRRAESWNNMIPVGIRGKQRNQRFALQMPVAMIKKCVKPESLIERDLNVFPHLRAKLANIYPLMQSLNLPWGYTGSVGFELATGLRTVTENSDIDLLIRVRKAMSKTDAQDILLRLDSLEMKLDIQLQTPAGGVALKEWATTTGKVLLKRNDNAVLVENPWC